MKKQIKSIVILVCICLSVTALMAVTNQFTAPIIKENQNAAENAALLEVMPNGESFEKVDLSSYTLPSTVTEAYRAKNGGYIVKLTTTGYSTGFVILCGVNADGTVSGVVCLESTETLGHEKTFGQNFVGKNSDEADKVDTISGATKTTGAYKSAVKDALNTAIILGGGSVDIRTDEEILLDNLCNTLGNLLDSTPRRHTLELTLRTIEIGHNSRLLVVNLDTIADNLLRLVIGAARILASQQNTLHKLLLRHLHIYHHRHRLAILGKNFIKSLGLHCCTRKAIKDCPFALIMSCDKGK